MTQFRDLFDIPRDVAFLTAASYSPLPRAVQATGCEGVARKGQPWKISPDFRGEQNTRARVAAARLIGAAAEDVALVPSVSYGFATVAQNLQLSAGDRVLVLQDDHASPVLAWQTPIQQSGAVLETIQAPVDGNWTAAVIDALQRPNSGPVALVSISMVHWADGALLDVAAIGAAARAAGSLYAVDATQAVGAIPVDIATFDPDFVMFPTYKWLLGPYGRAFFYVAKRHHEMRPLEETASGRLGVKSEGLTYLEDISYVSDASRFDMGERDHFITMEMASVGMELLQEIDTANVAASIEALNGEIADAFAGRAIVAKPYRSPHILCLKVTPDKAVGICEALAAQQIYVTARLGRVRVAPHIYNDSEDVHRFIEELSPLLESNAA